jgi:hypothetical protein
MRSKDYFAAVPAARGLFNKKGWRLPAFFVALELEFCLRGRRACLELRLSFTPLSI